MKRARRIRLLGLRLQQGLQLIECALGLGMLAVLIGGAWPLMRQMNLQKQVHKTLEWQERVRQSVESFAIAYGRLPCPALDDQGLEHTQDAALNGGVCAVSKGRLPWRTLSLPKPDGPWWYAVADLASLPSPYRAAHLRPFGMQGLSLQWLSSALYSPQNTAGNAGFLPGLLICDGTQGMPTAVANDSTCPGAGPVSVTAVYATQAEGSTAEQSLNQQASHRFFSATTTPSSALIWMSHEQLLWLWAKAGVL